MAPKKPITAEPSKKSNRFRLVVFEGDFSDDSVSEIAQALTSALKPNAPAVVRQLSGGRRTNQPPLSDHDQEEPADEGEEILEGDSVADEQEPEAPESAAPTRARGPRTYKNPEFVELPWVGIGDPPISLKEFSRDKAPQSKSRKYLTAAFWLKEYAGHPNVNIDQMYSCFRTAGWSVGFTDWRSTFDNLVRAKQMRRVSAGEFTITTLGEGALQTPEV